MVTGARYFTIKKKMLIRALFASAPSLESAALTCCSPHTHPTKMQMKRPPIGRKGNFTP
jgi:hypothetical protein